MANRLTLVAVAILVLVDVVLLFAVFRRGESSPEPRTAPIGSGRGGHGAVTSSPAPSAATSAGASSTGSASTSPRPSASAAPSSSPRGSGAATLTPSQGAETRGAAGGRRHIELAATSYLGQPFETVAIKGRYPGASAGTLLRVQHREGSRWLVFPLPTTTDSSGRFTAHVDMGGAGQYLLRVVDPRRKVLSPVVTLSIG
jgi:hypothetical protein